MRRGRAYRKGLCKFWPSPESLYQTFPITPNDPKVCASDCPSRYCISNMCIESYFAENHFPLLRPLRYDTAPAAFEISGDLG